MAAVKIKDSFVGPPLLGKPLCQLLERRQLVRLTEVTGFAIAVDDKTFHSSKDLEVRVGLEP